MCLIQTERLTLRPMTEAEIERLIASETDPHMIAAYGEMLEGGRAHPGEWKWNAVWQIALSTGILVGDFCFKGAPVDGKVEIGYGIQPSHQGKGYMTEAVHAAVRWALSQPGVTAVTAETEPHNAASQKVLRKCGFQPDGEGAEGPRFAVAKAGS